MKYKNWIAILVLFACFLSMLSLSLAKAEGVKWRNLTKDNPLRQAEILQDNKELQSLFLFPEEDFDEQEALRIVETIDALPHSLLLKTVDHGVRMKLFNGNLTENQSAAYLKGKAPRGYLNKDTTWDSVPGMGGSYTVLVKIGASDKGSGHGSVNLELHELAHSIDNIVYDGIREDIDYLRIWGKEVDVLFPGQSYFLNYPEEYFAETFAMFYVNFDQNQLLRQKAPETYNFIKQLD
ncbi:anthrax toxin lethal factor-related metalloendopeptidase [Peribacillus butanolivorans]|uniref:Toxin n=1 Tax=Peribacillus butanolivorans TaxID=421767 RepID=A0AAX0S370_9BACI|nr:toxin [Peribacillus butanolivorans]AXN37215.1 toxin [Peribacillus butanolivorans]PEJ32185.1 toxin [Peribacillus butanolivorans]QNU04312.1 toxin [Peribacillus butanolivorans]